MLHSSWDLEVFTRDLQERRWREAERARQFETLRRRDPARADGLTRALARLVARLRAPNSPQHPAQLAPPRPTPLPAEAPRATPAYTHPLEPPPRRPHRHADPYAAMPVIARGSARRNAEEPHIVPDC